MKKFYINSLIVFSCLSFMSNINANEIEFVWEEQYVSTNAIDSSNPMGDIQKDIAKQVNHYLSTRSRIDIEALIPLEIPKPLEPEQIKQPEQIQEIVLKQGKYELKKDFQIRVNEQQKRIKEKSEYQRKKYLEAVAKRNEKMEQLSKKFKYEVHERNKKIQELQVLLDNDISKVKKDQEDKLNKLETHIPIFVKNAFKKYLANPKIVKTEYFVDDGIMEAVLSSSNNELEYKIEFMVEPKEAQKMDQDLSLVKPKIYYKINSDPKNNALKLSHEYIVLNFNGKEYKVSQNSKQHYNKFMTASINIDDPSNVSIEEERLDLQTETLSLAYQEAKLKKVTYRVTGSENNEILSRLNKMRSVKKNGKKWLFVLGIENYNNGVEPIAYSNQSAKTFTLVAQKLLGVPENNTFSLLKDKTTSGQIKSDFKLMLDLVKDGDTIFFYYSGHGIPVPEDQNEPYILPKDISPSIINDEKFFKLNNIYTALSNSKAGEIIAVVDSCFSGATDGVNVLKGIASTRLSPKKMDNFNQNKMVVLTAGRDKQYSNMYEPKQHRLFSYFVMNALLENNKEVSSLYKDVYKRVERESRKMGNIKLQQPTIIGNKDLVF